MTSRATFFPTAVGMDDAEWHTLGVRYAEESDLNFGLGTPVVLQRNAGKIFRFSVAADGGKFEAEVDGAKARGKCDGK